jgi:trigger factor
MTFKITKHGELPENEYEIEGELTAEVVKGYREQALKDLGAGLKVDGFRPGHVPDKIVVDRFGEVVITEEAGRLALEKHYPEIMEKALKDTKIKPLGSPAVTITKVAPGEAFGFKIKTALMPEVKLGDFKSAAKKAMGEPVKVEATDKEIDEALLDLRKQVAHTDWHNAHPDEKGHGHAEHPTDDSLKDESKLPEVNEDFMKKFGDFPTLEAFKEKIKESIVAQKQKKEQDKRRLAAMDAILEKADFKIPKLLIESELSKMLNELGSNISQMGLNIETYLKHIGKNIEDLKKEWTPDAEKRAKTQLALNQIALDEKITVPEADIKKEAEALMNYYKDADRTRAEIYVETVLLNEKVWQFLEGLK